MSCPGKRYISLLLYKTSSDGALKCSDKVSIVSPVLVIYNSTSCLGIRIVCPSYMYSFGFIPLTPARRSTVVPSLFAISYRVSPCFTV